MFNNFPDFTDADTWIYIYAAAYGLGHFILRKLVKKVGVRLFDRFARNTPETKLKELEEIHKSMKAGYEERIAELENRLETSDGGE